MPKRPRRGLRSSNLALEAEYPNVIPLASRFAEEVAHQLDQLLADDGVSLSFPLQRRIKTWPSISEKLERKAISLNSIRDLNDLIGLRVVLQFRRDVEKVCVAIRSHFEVVEEYDTADRLKEDQFGYSSFHFIVRLPDAWLAVPTLSALRGFSAEIQVRTTAQHIWAAASHTLQYKHEAGVPPPIRRAIHRVSALLETVDLEFERVLTERETYRDAAGVLPDSEPLNVDLLERVLDEVWPPINKSVDREAYAELLADLQQFKVWTRRDLLTLGNKHKKQVLEKDAKTAAQFAGHPAIAEGAGIPVERISAGGYFSHVGLTRLMLTEEFGEQYRKYRGRVDRRGDD